MGLLKGILKIGLSPLRGVEEIIDDLSGNNTEIEQGGSILTLGASSVIKGTSKGVLEGVDEIFNN